MSRKPGRVLDLIIVAAEQHVFMVTPAAGTFSVNRPEFYVMSGSGRGTEPVLIPSPVGVVIVLTRPGDGDHFLMVEPRVTLGLVTSS